MSSTQSSHFDSIARVTPARYRILQSAEYSRPNLGKRSARLRAKTSLALERLESRLALSTLNWDDLDSHKWHGETAFGGATNEVDWLTFDGRDALQSRVTSSNSNFAMIRTDRFFAEDWRENVGLQADIYQVGGEPGVDVKLEVSGADFHPPIEAEVCNNLLRDTWTTCTWMLDTSLPGYANVSHLSLVFDNIANTGPTFYVDDMRLLTKNGTEEWDNMDDGSRNWFYSGNWVNWRPNTEFGLELVTHNGDNPTTPAGSLYLQWDVITGCCPGSNTAEIGTNQLNDLSDWSSYNRVMADVRTSDPNADISIFFWDAETQTSFSTPMRKAGADSWRSVVWDLPWPPTFDNTGIDEVKFVVNDIAQHPTGTLFLDNIRLVADGFPEPLSGLNYRFASFGRRSDITEFSSNWFAPDAVVVNEAEGALEVNYTQSGSTTVFSIWGDSECKEADPTDRCNAPQSLDFTDVFGRANEVKDFEQIQFRVRGSGRTQNVHNVRVELKDITDRFDKTAFRYFTIDDSNTAWQQIVLDADVLNGDFWSYNEDRPDPRQMKFLIFVVDSSLNAPSGTFFIDDIEFVDADDAPFNLDQNSDDAFLDLVSRRAFSYFLDWYDPKTGLFQDRSEFPDLMSIAATGFGLTALTIGEQRGWIDRQVAIDMITRTLTTLRDGQSPTDTIEDVRANTNGYNGFYYHFLNTEGKRQVDISPGGGSELSTVDTALLIMGALTAKEHFSDVPAIGSLVDEIYERVDWDWFHDGPTNQFYQGWKPERDNDAQNGLFEYLAPGGGFFSSRADGSQLTWDYSTDEVMLISILAIASPTHSVPKNVFYAWARIIDEYGGHELVRSFDGSFFTYVFAHLWIDFEPLGQDKPPKDGPVAVDWWENSVQATLANQQFAIDNADEFPTYGGNSFGLTAAEGPDGAYHAYGALPADPDANDDNPPDHDGTIAAYGAASAIMFQPDIAIAALEHFFSATDLWNYRLGFGDAFNLDAESLLDAETVDVRWYNRAVFGIDNGPMLLAIENARTRFVWETMKRNNAIQEVLSQLFQGKAMGKLLALAEVTPFGVIQSGNRAHTFISDDEYEVLREELTPDGRLEHIWKFKLPPSDQVTFSIEAHTNTTSEVFFTHYSVDEGQTWKDLLTVRKTSDDDQAQTLVLPDAISGSVWVRARDSDRTGDGTVDDLFVDHIGFQLVNGGGNAAVEGLGTSTVRLLGTSENDLFAFSAGEKHLVCANAECFVLDPSVVTTVEIDSAAGDDDTVHLFGDGGRDVAGLRPRSVELAGNGYVARAKNSEQIRIDSGGGLDDRATFRDSPGNDQFSADPHSAQLTGPGFSNEAKGFHRMLAFRIAGGDDVAEMFDSPGRDFFVSGPDFGRLGGNGFYIYAGNFGQVVAHAVNGGHDRAFMNDSPGNDSYSASPQTAQMVGSGFDNMAHGFDRTYGMATAGGNDVANLVGSDGRDYFLGMADFGRLSGALYHNRVEGFGMVNAAGGAGFDVGYLHATDGICTHNEDSSHLEGGDMEYWLTEFERVYCFGPADGRARFFQLDNDDLFKGAGNLAAVFGPGRDQRAIGFGTVEAHAKPGQAPSSMIGAIDYVLERFGW